MAVIIGGHETGLLDSSLTLLNRNDRTHLGDPGHATQLFVNVSNGNLSIQHQDAYLPSLGDDYSLVRTYNARGRASDAHQHEDARWTWSTWVRLDVRNDGGQQYFEVEYGDGSFFDYQLDTATGLYVSTDGAGAFETIEDLGTTGTNEPSYILTRANQSKLSFDSQGRLLSWVDTNGVRVDYVYESDRLVQVLDDQGHVINYVYLNGHLFQITDETQGVLVEYRYESGRLSEVIDRYGHSTKYFYTNNGFLERVVLPNTQVVAGQLETYDSREISLQYDTVNWRGNNQATAQTVTRIIDAEGGITTFDYDFQFSTPGSTNTNGTTSGNGKKLGHFKNGKADTTTDPNATNEDKFFDGGTTTVVDALGNNRAYSNDAEYSVWRLENGFYEIYDPNQAATNPAYQLQVDAIRQQHSLSYTYRDDGYITEVVDQQGFKTTYLYDSDANLIAITDRNGFAAISSDSPYYRKVRQELGIVDAGGNGKLVGDLSEADKNTLLEAFTRNFAYDDNGNVISIADNAGNLTTYTYTAFNKIASSTTPMGNALVSSDEQLYQDRRVELGFAPLVANLSAADVQAILDLHSTFFEYDSNQNLIERRDPGGDITRFAYDGFGNQVQRTVFLDPNDLVDPAKQQVTTYAYDAFGNQISSTDAEGNHAFSEYDHFGNLTQTIDGNGGVTSFTYDADDRLLSVTDPEGHVTIFTYDAVGNRISVTDANGHTVTHVYDRNNNLLAKIDRSETDPLQDRITTSEYDLVGNRTATVDDEGRRTEFRYDTRRKLVEVITAEVGDENGIPTQYRSSFAYDGEGNRVRVTNNRGFATDIFFNQNNLLREQTDANGHITRMSYDANNNRVQVVAGVQLSAARRQIVQFSFDEENQLTTQIDAEGNVTRFGYDAPGNRVEVVDANGNTMNFEYDGNNRLIREILPEVIDPQTGLPTRYTIEHVFDANGNQIETIDENGNSTKFTFDKDDKVVSVEDANGIKTIFQYDSRENRTAVIIGADVSVGQTVVNVDDAQITRFVYDEFNQLIAQTDGVGNALAESNAAIYQEIRQELGYAALVADLSTADQQALRDLYTSRFTYDRVGNQLSKTDHLGRVTQFEFDALNRQIGRTDALGQETRFRYDGNSNRVAQVDALGRETSFIYDGLDRLTDTVDPLGVVSRREYDDFGNLLSETRAAGTTDARTHNYEYDLNNRVISQIDPEANRQSFEYDALGNRLRVTDARGNATQFVYDALNRNVKIIDPLSFETRFEYDGVGNRLALIDARGGVTRFEFDPGDRRVATTDAEGRITRFTYDVRGNRIEQRTASGTADEQLTVFEYDAENNLRRAIDAEGSVVSNDYDRVYNLIESVDGRGNATTTEFDAIDRVIRITDAEGGISEFFYDAVDNLLQQTDPLGRTTTFAYDAKDRLIVQTAADGIESHYAYDPVNNRTAVTRAANTADSATDTFTYDLNDRLVEQRDALGNLTRFVYDENGNRTTEIDANGNATLYLFDANNRVVEIVDPEGNLTTYDYDGSGNRNRITDARGNHTVAYFNANNEVDLSVDAEGFATSYVYDNNGNVVSQTLHMQALSLPLDPAVRPIPAAGAGDQTISFEYDRLNRVTARIDAEGFRTEFDFDAVGNRVQSRVFRDLAGTDIAVTRSYYDNLNREIAMLTAEGYLVELAYDAVGNRVLRRVYDERVSPPASGLPQANTGDIGRAQVFAYDAVNRLIRETSPLAIDTEFEYDDRGNRTAMVEASGTTDQRRSEFLFDRADRLIESIDAAGTITRLSLDANGNVLERREALGTIDERLTSFTYDRNNRNASQTDPLGVVTLMGYDGNGNVLSITRAAGSAAERVETFEYDRNNRRTAEINGEGERTESAYDGAGNRVRLVLAPGLAEERVNSFEFDRDNRLVAGIDGEGVRTEYRYDGAGNKIETIQAVGLVGQERHSLYQYDLDNRLLRITDPMGFATEYEYDVLGNQVRTINANGYEQLSTFDALGRLLSSLSAGGTLTVNTYDLRGNILSTAQSFADGSDARTTLYEYDLLDRQTRVTDPEGFSTDIDYDVFGNQVRVTHGLYLANPGDAGYDADKAARAFAQTNVFAYDAADRLTRLTDGEGNDTTYSYDAVGNRTSVTEAANSAPRTTSFYYDLANRVVESVNPEGGISRNTYDETGNLITEAILQSDDGAGNQVWINRDFEYDGNARLAAEIDGIGVRTEREYDAMGNEVIVRAAAGSADQRVTRKEYDLNNRVRAEIDGENNRTEFAYDSLGNRIRVTDALNRVARFYFDGANRLISILDAEGFINEFTYDSVGNRIAERVYFARYAGTVDDFTPPVATTSAQDRNSTSVFDGNNRIVVRTEADGRRSEFEYDAAGNLLREVQFANTAAPREIDYIYDLNNRLIEITDVDGTVTRYAYDGANNQVSETISNPGESAVRQTTFAYDLNNRLVSETFDPGGFDFVQSSVYDRVGNVVEQVDANGGVTRFTYDLNDRVVVRTDALGNSTSIVYDAVGNQISVTDPRGVETEFTYDNNNRLASEILPSAQIYTIDGGLQTLRPLIQHFYDAAGNEIQTIDGNGLKTTRYFDSNDRLVAEVSGDNVLREFTYSAAGDQLSETLYMTFLPTAAHDPAVLPAPPAGDARTIVREYDLAGRVTRTIYPSVEVTLLANTGSDNPLETRVTIQPDERIVYNGFGNAVESFDRNGNRTVAYFDARDRQVAVVDAEGFLTEFDYDSQDNVIEQRSYALALDIATIDPAVRPTPPAGEVYVVNRSYDLASRVVEELSPAVDVFDPVTRTSSSERVLTRFGYDALGNQLARTIAAGTPQELTEYSYYDALSRQVATVDGNRVVNLFRYDANGNQTTAKRLFNAVAAGVDLAGLDGTTDFAALVGSNVHDQALERVYDALNRLASETELMGPGTIDDLTQNFRYDANGNRSFAQDQDGFVQEFSYNAAGQVLQSISPDGGGSVAEFDAAGNQIFLFTGQIDSQAQPATGLSAVVAEDLTIAWQLQPGSQVETYLVYDSVSRSLPEQYANQGAVQATWFGNSGADSIPAAQFSPGDTIFFRVVSRDIAGNLAWTGERSLTVPPRFDDVVVAQTGADSYTVSATFEGGAVNPVLLFGMPGAANSSAAFFDQGGGRYTATLSGVTNIQELVYQIRWQDGGGQTFTSSETRFEAGGGHAGVTTFVSETSVLDGGSTLFIVNAEVRVPSSLANDLLVVVGDFDQIGGADNQGGTSVEGVDSGLGYHTYTLALGEGDLLEAGDYTITLRGLAAEGDILLDEFNVSVGGGMALSATERGLSWTAPAVGDGQLVVIDGLRADAGRVEGRLLVDAEVAVGSFGYDVFYGTLAADAHTTTVTSTEVTDTDDTTTPPTVTVLGYDLGVSTTLAAAESANVAGDVQLAWRAAGSGTEFVNQVALTAAGDTYSTTLALLAAGEYDLKLFYTDLDGNEVILDWLRVDTAVASVSESNNSVTVLASETDAILSLDANDVFTIDPGLYTGPVGDAGQFQPLSLNVGLPGDPGGALSVDGRDTGYFSENRFDALDNRIATNEETGVWREFGVDANGNVVATYVYGEEGAADPVVTYAAFDGRDRNIARFDAPTAVHGETGERRAVTRFGYDLFDNVVSETDPGGNLKTSVFNGLGSVVSETDQLFNTRTFGYDRLGNQTRETDALGNSRYRVYDNAGRLIQEEDAEGNLTTFTYDVFDRRLTVTNALGQTVHSEYDQRDRQVRATDGLGKVSEYEYDGRDNRTITIDANGNRFEQSWDALGRVDETITFQNGQQISERNQYDIYGNLIAEIDGEGRVRSSINGAFGRVDQEVDEGGRQTFFEYDRFGNLVRETSPSSGKNIVRIYDAANRLIEVNDLGTGVRTTYSYDISGARMSENVTTPGNAHDRSVSYEYDALGQMVRWADGVTGMQLNYLWDAAGNLFRAFTDPGYDPENESLAPGELFIDHVYTYDANNRVTRIDQRGALDRQFGYDAAGNRAIFNDAGQLTTYAFDANGRVVTASTNGNTVASWQYDDVGNILNFQTFDANGASTGSKTQQYYENNRSFFTRDVGDDGKAQETTLTLDDSGRVTRTVLKDGGNTFYFTHNYFADGRERSITGTGKASGTSTSTYDANDNLVRLDKGRGDTQESNEFLTFVYNNDGQILYRFHEQGQSDETATDTEFAYANGDPVGETGNDKDNNLQTELDTGRYSLVQNLGEDFPNSAVTFVTTGANDSLQGIADRVYGNPSLWFVIAEANGLRGGEELKEGTRLQIPNTVKTGRLTADTHAVYDQGEIVGSTLPNLKSPPPKKKGCGSFLAIIIVVVIAVVAVIATAGLASAFLGTAGTFLGLTGTAATVAAFATAGLIVGAAASIVQQGLFIALGYQDKFSWKSVAAGAISGAFSGAAAGLGQAVQAAAKVGETIKYAKAASAALKIASVASKQLIENGKITSWTSLASAGIGASIEASRFQRLGELEALSEAAGETATQLALRVATDTGLRSLSQFQTAVNYVTPWVQLAETAVRNDGEVTAGDWVSAVGATLGSALRVAPGGSDFSSRLENAAVNSGIKLAIGGALSLYDRDAALDWTFDAVGNEVGQFIGQVLTVNTGLQAAVDRRLEALRDRLSQSFIKADGMMALAATPAGAGPVIVTGSDDDPEKLDAPETGDRSATTRAEQAAAESGSVTGRRTVQAGETLAGIVSDAYGVGYNEDLILRIAQLNGLADPNQIRAGQSLILPVDLNSSLLTGIQIDEALRTALRQSNAVDGVALEQTGSSAVAVTAESLNENVAGLDNAIQSSISQGDLEAAQKLEDVKRLLEEYIAIIKESQEQQRRELAENSTLENIGRGIKNFGVGLWETGKLVVGVAFSILQERDALARDIASGLLNGGDFSALNNRVGGYFDSAERGIEFARTAGEIAQFILENDELRGIITQGAQDILGDINGDQITVFAGELVGELILAVATAGTGAAASAARRGGTTAVKLFEELQSLVTLSRGRRDIVPDRVPTRNSVKLNTREDFRSASRNPQPNTVYEFDGFTYTTDELGRGINSSGQLRLGAGGNRFHDDRLIGHQGVQDDIAFHAGADEFGFQGGPLNLSPGNKMLNIREYRALERELKGLLQQGHTVDADFRRVFYPNNTSLRPDEYRVIYRVDGGNPETRTFHNQEGG